MSFSIKPQKDYPVSDAELLGIKETVEVLKTFLESDEMIAPLSIAVSGDWGSGKTSLLRTLEKKLNSEKITTIFFEAWKYEYANPAMALISHIATELSSSSKARQIITLAADIFTRKYLNISYEHIVDHFESNSKTVKNFSDELKQAISEKIGTTKLVVLLDDLDRCDVENVLTILSMMKLFLDQDNCICVAAVDFKRLEHAWKKKYGFLDESDIEEGRSYLEKIFQIRIGMPHPSDIQIKEYLHKLVPDFTPEILDVLAAVGPVNPRAIIKMINLMVFRSSLFQTSDTSIAVVGWTVLEEILTPKGAAELYSKINGGENLIKNILNHGENITQFEQAIGTGYIDTLVRNHQAAKGHLRLFFEKSQSILKKLGSTSALEVGKQIDRIYEISNEYSRFSVPK